MSEKRNMIRQHEAIRVPEGWKPQERALIMQLERIFDDIYKQLSGFGKPKEYTNTATKNVSVYELPGGLMITTIKEEVTVDIDNTSGNIYYGTISAETFPVSYSEVPMVFPSTLKSETNAWVWGGASGPSKTSTGSLYIARGTSATSKKIWIQWLAIGKK